MERRATKPLGHRSYGSIPHLLGSRRGPADKGVNDGQQRIMCENSRSKKGGAYTIIVQEKLDGSNVSVAKIDGAIVPLMRAGYRCEESNFRQHHEFAKWVYERQSSFDAFLEDGERLCGEWLWLAHGTLYDLSHRSPFVAFDIMRGQQRASFQEFTERVEWCVDTQLFDVPPLLHCGGAISVKDSLKALGENGKYGAKELAEGVVYRAEYGGKIEFLAKYVRPEKVDGKYLDQEIQMWSEI